MAGDSSGTYEAPQGSVLTSYPEIIPNILLLLYVSFQRYKKLHIKTVAFIERLLTRDKQDILGVSKKSTV